MLILKSYVASRWSWFVVSKILKNSFHAFPGIPLLSNASVRISASSDVTGGQLKGRYEEDDMKFNM